MVKEVSLPEGLAGDLRDSLAESDPLEDAWTELSAQEPLPRKEHNGHAGNGHAKTPIERIFKPTRVDVGNDLV